MSAFDRFWLAPASAERLATLRVTCGAFCLIYLLVRANVLVDFRAVTAAQWEPVGITHLISGPVPPALVIALWAGCVASAVCFTLGVRYRLTGPLFALLLLWVTSYRSSFGMIFHNDNMAVLHALVLGLCPAAAEALSLDARGTEARSDHGRFGWPIKLLCAATAATYVIAGVAKLRGAGLHWADGDVLRHYVAYDAVRKQALGSIHSPLGAWLAQYAWPFPAFSALTLVLELGAPFALLGGRVAAVWALGVWGFHLSVLALMAIAFPYPLTVGLLPFLPAERIWRFKPLTRLHGWLARGLVAACVLTALTACNSPEPASRIPSPETPLPKPAPAPAPAPDPDPDPDPNPASPGIDGRSMPSPSAGAELAFDTLLGDHLLPGGIRLEHSLNLPTALGVRESHGRFSGVLEIVASEAGDLTGELDTHLLKYARNFYDLVKTDRATGGYGDDFRVLTDEPVLLRVGQLRGVRYGFTEQKGKRVIHRLLSAAVVQGSHLYVIVCSAPAGVDGDSSFATLELLQRFEPHFPALLASLRFPAP